ncbi:MAG: hypothetical protein OXG85_06265 [Chloroflexi bacterium]|nr:hypothetical protein [Chloroflexota bacterium]
MSIAGLLISLLLAGVAIAIVARPLFQSRRSGASGVDRGRQEEQLRTLYERVLTNIRDLDEDLATGKISAVDQREEREVWVQQGIGLLRALDEMAKETSAASSQMDAEGVDQAIEAAVAAYRQGGSAAGQGRG